MPSEHKVLQGKRAHKMQQGTRAPRGGGWASRAACAKPGPSIHFLFGLLAGRPRARSAQQKPDTPHPARARQPPDLV